MKNLNDFRNNLSNLRSSRKNLEVTLICRFLLGTWLHIQREDGANILAYGLPKETVTAIMMLYKNSIVKVRSLDGNTDFFDIVASDMQSPYLFLIYQH